MDCEHFGFTPTGPMLLEVLLMAANVPIWVYVIGTLLTWC
jgi:hypothetical protein